MLPDSEFTAKFTDRVGHGFRFWKNGKAQVYDLSRERRFELGDGFHEVWVRAGRWIVEHDVDDQRHREQCLFDPDTKAFSPLPPSIAKLDFEYVATARQPAQRNTQRGKDAPPSPAGPPFARAQGLHVHPQKLTRSVTLTLELGG